MIPIASGDGFSGWHALNDTVMGGRSQGSCQVGPQGLVFDGLLIEEGGGFISCRSPLFSPPLDLSWWGRDVASNWRWPVPMAWQD